MFDLMKKNYFCPRLVTALISCCVSLIAGMSVAKAAEPITWKGDFPALPDPYGVAGAFAGIVSEGAERYLVVAGGANFPYENPFDDALNANGGQPKVWHDEGFVIPISSSSLDAKGEWKKLKTGLPKPLGYGASVNLPQHGTALFIGGSAEVGGTEQFSSSVYEVSAKSGEIAFQEISPLPVGLSYTAASRVGSRVYVFSGQSAAGEVAAAWVLDTASADRSGWRWEELPWPMFSAELPARARSFHAMGMQGGKVFVFGGRAAHQPNDGRVDEEDLNLVHKQDFFRDCYVYSPGGKIAAAGTWERIADLPRGISASPSKAIPAGASHLLLLSGAEVGFLNSLQDRERFPALNDARQGFEHPGFPREVLGYHMITNTWSVQGAIPEGSRVPVTAPVVLDGKFFLVPSGEWSPKLRTPAVLSGAIGIAAVTAFGWINWLVVAVYLLSMVGVGYWFMKRESASSTEAYFRGGQRIPAWVAGLSIFATMLSALTFMGIPARAYETDISWWIGQVPILIIAPLVAFCYLPFFRRLNVTSAYEYLEKRFGLPVRLFASLSFILFHIGRIAIVLYLPALAISAVTGMEVTTAILIMSVLCIIYTVMGGIEAVVWTDAIQALVLMGGAVLCFLLVIYKVDGGFSEVMSIAQRDHKLFSNLEWGSFDLKEGTTAGVILFAAFFFNSLVPYTSGQDVVQRYVTTADEKSARKSLWITMWMSLFGSLVFFGLGAAIYAFYKTHPDLLNPAMEKTDGILPFYIVQQLPVGLSGLIIAAIFAAAQSTISSSLNSSATAYIKDFDERILRPGRDDKTYLRSAQFAVLLIGIFGTVVAVIMAKSNIEGAFKMFNHIVGLTAGSLGGLFALGIFTRKANGKAALISALVGSGVVVTMFIMGAPVTGLLYALIGFMTCLLVGIVLGFFMRAKPEQLKGLSWRSRK